jgi:hypothetical protein
MTLEQLKRLVKTRFLAYPRFRQKTVDTAAGAFWEDDADFDLDWHVRLSALPGRAASASSSASSASRPRRRSTRPSRCGSSTWWRSTAAAARRWSRASTTATPTAWRWCR